MIKLTSPFTIIKKSFEIFTKKENFVFFVKIYLPLGVLSLISLAFIGIPFLSQTSGTPLGNIITTVLNILFFFTSIYVNAAGILAIIKVLEGKDLNAKKIYVEAFKKFGKFILLSLVIYLSYILGLVLLIIPFFIVIVWFAFGQFVMIERGFGIKKSILESKKLVKGIYWKVLLRMVVFGVFWILMEAALGLLPYSLGVVIFYISGALFVLPSFILYKEISSE